ncbi:FHA domain-containing protein [Frankia sp. AiPs1]|nr:hypothetical protein [Frankia sp. AiPa1]MCL9759877.1 hypothetical protein [Frankia sp. AiPa1]
MQVPAERWVLAYEHGPRRCRVPVGGRLGIGRSLTVGREGRLPLGVEVPNSRISREALVVTATETGWDLEVRNRNGATLHVWGQPPRAVYGQVQVCWPRIAVRILTRELPVRTYHWVLLEADLPMLPTAGAGPPRGTTTGMTVTPPPPLPMTSAQEEAVRLVFAELLHWPPVLPARTLQLKQAASRLRISEQGVRDRLGWAHNRALHLGLHQEVGLTEPDYLYFLVNSGYLAPPATRPCRIVRPWLDDG